MTVDSPLFIRLYIDEDVHESIALALRRHGYDVVNVREANRRGLSDAEQLACAVGGHQQSRLSHSASLRGPCGYLNSPELAAQPGTIYHVSAWVRGEIDAKEIAGKWKLRAYYYDANHTALSYTDPDEGSTISASWSEEGGDFTTPANAAYPSTALTSPRKRSDAGGAGVRLQLYHYLNSGRVAWEPALSVRLSGLRVSLSRTPHAEGLPKGAPDRAGGDDTVLLRRRPARGHAQEWRAALPAGRPSHASLRTIAWAARPFPSASLQRGDYSHGQQQRR